MEEETNIKDVVQEIKEASEEDLKKVIEQWFESTRTAGMKIGAQYISAGIFGVIQKHIKKKAKPSLRDYQRCMDEIIKIISVQLTQQNDSKKVVEEVVNDDK
jgi:O-acetyl-ADP-ribose deacetylase (regulator of RNase III)